MKITKTQLKQIIKEELENTLKQTKASEVIMSQLKALGWNEEDHSALGTPAGSSYDYIDAKTRADLERKYEEHMSNPEIRELLKQYAEAKKAEYSERQSFLRK